MTVRSEMSNIIVQLRSMTNAGSEDFSIGSVNYFSDEHMQNALDKHRFFVVEQPLDPVAQYQDSETVYLEYLSGRQWLEGGTIATVIRDNNGSLVTGYTADYENGRFTFTEDTGGSVYYLTSRQYDLDKTAADIWRRKASYFAEGYDISAGNQRMSRSQLMQMALEMAQQYDSMASPNRLEITRDDCLI